MNEPASDDVLMLRYKDGDLSAFEIIIEKHQQPLISFVYRFCNDYHQAQDLVQDVFLRLVKVSRNYVPRAKFTTYLYTIAHNVCIDHLRRKERRGTVSLSEPVDKENQITLEETMKDERANPQRDFQQKN